MVLCERPLRTGSVKSCNEGPESLRLRLRLSEYVGLVIVKSTCRIPSRQGEVGTALRIRTATVHALAQRVVGSASRTLNPLDQGRIHPVSLRGGDFSKIWSSILVTASQLYAK